MKASQGTDIWEQWAYAVTYGAETQQLYGLTIYEALSRGDAVVHDSGIACIRAGFHVSIPNWYKSQNLAWTRGMTRLVARIRSGER